MRNTAVDLKEYGTIEFCAPEYYDGKTPTIQSDIYSLGIVFYTLLTGHLPFTGKKENIISNKKLNNK